ncbi:CvpA family protein [Candidatus Palibaumannia cicadellinicola]|uniref:Colicin V production protein n=1 Tax=Candidatus Palibaumannia cicadellinicola TaxID=186490 RepID=A0A0K2BLG9_9GAMM|nr:CvpA family protein [Candidatus Baumannia cicadellinicola]AKZ65908.1 Colicin V production protein [Candidatus Baumannia cicadellinicola]
MNWIDYLIILIIIVSILISIIRGFIKETLSLTTLVCAFFISGNLYKDIAITFTKVEEPIIKNIIAIVLLFIATMIVGKIINIITQSLVERTGLSGIDRVLGVFFGLLRGILIVSVVLLFIEKLTIVTANPDWQQSQLIPKFRSFIKLFLKYI